MKSPRSRKIPLQGNETEPFDREIFLVRWANGDFSIVAANCYRDAIEQLDELGNVEDSSIQVWRMEHCLLDFTLDEEGNYQLVYPHGGATESEIMERCYPILNELRAEASPAEILEAVKKEKKRNWFKGRLKKPRTELGKRIQAQSNMPGSLVDRYIEEDATETLKHLKTKGTTRQ